MTKYKIFYYSIFISIFFYSNGLANAMCSSYKNNSAHSAPVVKICFGNKCEITQQEYFCDNSNSTQFVYKNGLDITVNKSRYNYVMSVIYKGRRIHKKRWSDLTCAELKGYGDSCFNLTGNLSNFIEN